MKNIKIDNLLIIAVCSLIIGTLDYIYDKDQWTILWFSTFELFGLLSLYYRKI